MRIKCMSKTINGNWKWLSLLHLTMSRWINTIRGLFSRRNRVFCSTCLTFSKVPELRPAKQKTKKKAHKKSFSLDIKSRSHTRCCSMYMEADSKKSEGSSKKTEPTLLSDDCTQKVGHDFLSYYWVFKAEKEMGSQYNKSFLVFFKRRAIWGPKTKDNFQLRKIRQITWCHLVVSRDFSNLSKNSSIWVCSLRSHILRRYQIGVW